MDWDALLRSELEDAYRAADALIARVEDDQLGWEPATGQNWMTTGQLLEHTATACGAVFRAFVTGDWRQPDGSSLTEMPPEEMLPPADKMPAAGSVEAARQALAEDKQTALAMLEAAAGRMDEPTTAPWDPTPRPLGQQLLKMVNHLNQHKAQLFYYLKLQGQPVNTMHYFGMG